MMDNRYGHQQMTDHWTDDRDTYSSLNKDIDRFDLKGRMKETKSKIKDATGSDKDALKDHLKYLKDQQKQGKQADKDFREHLSNSHGQDFTKAEASFFAKAASSSYSDYSKGMSMKRADAMREAGEWTKSPGLHTGYGFGAKGSINASAADSWKSFVHDTPYVAKEGFLNSMGMLTAQQKMSYAASGTLGKAMIASNPLASAYMIGSSMLDLQDPLSIVSEQTAQGAAFTGFVAGTRLGAQLPFKGFAARAAARGAVGGVVGVAAYAAVEGVTAGIRDITSAESTIGTMAYKASQRDNYGDITQNRATLTARQKALQQVNSSVFNDRGFTLGNEASILRNVSL